MKRRRSHGTQRHSTGLYWLMLFGLLGAPVSAEIQTITSGHSLAISCGQAMRVLEKQDDSTSTSITNDAFVCMAYLSGIMAATQHANQLAKLRFAQATQGQGNQADFAIYCFNWQLSYKNIARIVLNFAHNEPVYLQRPAHEMVLRALQKTFPCR